MSNSARHSQAATTVVSLKNIPHPVRLEVSDNGVGFSPETIKTTGYGLKNMTARAREIGAEVKIDSQPGHGTRIVIDIPKPT
jgi:signal transduction histidine kinase